MEISKKIIRDNMQRLRNELSQVTVEQCSTAIQDRILKAPFWPKKGGVGLYYPIKNEVMTQTLFQRALETGLHVYFPRVEQGIVFYEVNGPEDLQRGCWSVLEPRRHCAPYAPENTLDLLIVPGVVYSPACKRIGSGRGLYDRYVADAEYDGPVIGLAYECQMMDSFPTDEWDQGVDGVMTEKNFYAKK
ncbi:MAG: 5-formyltetrahydrofolate cyclo-ligase [Deltaproteobacteria bacterium]|nr:5-formyltetrahydrofolate cyclo-ligase [Deltaproteobacteria bacterium]